MHPSIHVPVELAGLYSSLPKRLKHYSDLSRPFDRRLLAEHLRNLGHLSDLPGNFDPERFEDLLPAKEIDSKTVIECFYQTILEGTPKRILGDKTPDHLPYFQNIVRLFPNAQILHLVRDGRDCALSSMAWRQGINFRNTFELARAWARHNARLADFGRENPNRYLNIRYEDLIREPEPVLRKITHFLGEDYDPAMLEYQSGSFARANADHLGHHQNLTQTLMPNNSGKWEKKMPADQVKVYESLAGDVLQTFGYPVSFDRQGIRWLVLRELWRGSTWARMGARRLRRFNKNSRFMVALTIKRKLQVIRLRDAVPSYFREFP